MGDNRFMVFVVWKIKFYLNSLATSRRIKSAVY